MNNRIEMTDRIPRERYNQWFEIFRATDGCFLSNPRVWRDEVSVRISLGLDDYKQLNEAFERLSIKIVETKRGWFKAMIKRWLG